MQKPSILVAAQRLVVGLGIAGVALGCQSPGLTYAEHGEALTTADGLHRVRSSPVAAEWVQPGADLGPYRKVMLDDVTFSYRRTARSVPYDSEGTQAVSAMEFAPSKETVETMRKTFQEAFSEQLRQSRSFEIATAPGPDVLRVSGHLVHLTMFTPPSSVKPAEGTISPTPGQVTLVLDVRDSVSGEAFVRMADRKPFDSEAVTGFQEQDPVYTSDSVRRVFKQWAIDLRVNLDRIHEMPIPELPPA